MTPLPPIALRPLNVEDVEELNHVRKTWLQHAAESAFAQSMMRPVFVEDFLPWRDRIMARANTLVACLEKQPDAVLGWACSETQRGVLVLHFVHVKRRWRQLGIAKRLIAPLLSEPVVMSHRTFMAHELPIPEQWTFRPLAAFFTPENERPTDAPDDVRLHHVPDDGARPEAGRG